MFICETFNQHMSYRTLQNHKKNKNNEIPKAKNQNFTLNQNFLEVSKSSFKNTNKYKTEENNFMT